MQHPLTTRSVVMRRELRKNFTNAGDDDEHGHGTHCAGTIFGRTVENKRIGVAPGVKKAIIGKVLGGNGGGSDIVMQAIQWAANNGAKGTPANRAKTRIRRFMDERWRDYFFAAPLSTCATARCQPE